MADAKSTPLIFWEKKVLGTYSYGPKKKIKRGKGPMETTSFMSFHSMDYTTTIGIEISPQPPYKAFNYVILVQKSPTFLSPIFVEILEVLLLFSFDSKHSDTENESVFFLFYTTLRYPNSRQRDLTA